MVANKFMVDQTDVLFCLLLLVCMLCVRLINVVANWTDSGSPAFVFTGLSQ